MIKALIFDMDGVVILGDRQKIYDKLAKSFKLDWERFREARHKYLDHALLGKMSESEYYKRVVSELGLKEGEKFVESWKKQLDGLLKLDKRMEKLLVRLKKNYTVGTLTNVSPMHERPRNKNKVYRYFHNKIKSIEVKALKPSLRIYKILLKKLKLPAKEVVFIDDAPENLPPARKLGMNTILFKGRARLIKDLKKLGVKL